MTSLLAGSLARTINKALSPIFLPATLTRGGATYACRAIFDKWAPEFGVSTSDGTVLILAGSLSTTPQAGDQLSFQGRSVVVASLLPTKPAISTDPAIAVWTLACKQMPIQGSTYAGYAAVAAAIGQPFDLYRPTIGQAPLATPKITTLPAQFTNAKASGFNFDKGQGYDDVLWNALVDGTQLHVGDYLFGAGATYFVAAMPPLEPISCVRCNAVVALTRPSKEVTTVGGQAPGLQSQPGSTGTVWGVSTTPVTDDTQAGEIAVAAGIPVCILGTSGRATGNGELPTDAPGPSRWRIHMPPSVCPKGTVQDRDVITDDENYRYKVSSANWTVIGYRAEAIRTED